MLRLGICGKDKSLLESIKKVLLEYSGTEEVELFGNREEMFRYILQAGENLNVMIMDLCSGGGKSGV